MCAGVPSVHQPRNTKPIPQRQQQRIQPRALRSRPIVRPQVLQLRGRTVLAPAELGVPLGEGVGLAVVRHQGAAEDVVGQDEAARLQDPIGAAAGLGAGEDGVEVGWVAVLLGVDEDEIVGLGGVELGQPVDEKFGVSMSRITKRRPPLKPSNRTRRLWGVMYSKGIYVRVVQRTS